MTLIEKCQILTLGAFLCLYFNEGRMPVAADSKKAAGSQEAIGETAAQSNVVAVDR